MEYIRHIPLYTRLSPLRTGHWWDRKPDTRMGPLHNKRVPTERNLRFDLGCSAQDNFARS